MEADKQNPFGNILGNIKDSFLVLDLNGNILSFNKRAASLFLLPEKPGNLFDFLSATNKESPCTDESLLKKLITPSEIRTIDDLSASEGDKDSIKRSDIEYVRLTPDRVKELNLTTRQRLEEVRKESFDQAKKSYETTRCVL